MFKDEKFLRVKWHRNLSQCMIHGVYMQWLRIIVSYGILQVLWYFFFWFDSAMVSEDEVKHAKDIVVSVILLETTQ